MPRRRELSFERETNRPCHSRNGGMFGRVYYRSGNSLHAPVDVQLGKVIPDLSQPLALIKLVHSSLVEQNPRRLVARIDERQIVGIGLARLCFDAAHIDSPKKPQKIRHELFRLEGAGGILVARQGQEPFDIQPQQTRVKKAIGNAGIHELPLPRSDDASAGITLRPAVYLSPVMLPTDAPITQGIELHVEDEKGHRIYGAISEGVQIAYADTLWPRPQVPGHPAVD